jgi:hypothetical protein
MSISPRRRRCKQSALYSQLSSSGLPPPLRLRRASIGEPWRSRPQAYGIFLTHYIFIIWLQYAVYDYSWPAIVKFAIVLSGTLALNWSVTVLLRRIPAVARMI